jgi:hypothetical protein
MPLAKWVIICQNSTPLVIEHSLLDENLDEASPLLVLNHLNKPFFHCPTINL